MATQTFEESRSIRVYSFVITPILVVLFAVLAVGAAGEGARLIAPAAGIVVVLWVFARYTLWQPYRVTLDDEGVHLQASVRQVTIPWAELEAVEPPGWDPQRRRLDWCRTDGRVVRTSSPFVDAHRMLSEIERRAPRARVSS